MNIQEWKQRYIAELVRLGWDQNDAESDFRSGYCDKDGHVAESIDLDDSPESVAQDEHSYACEG